MYQCYFTNKAGVQCTNKQEECWCCDEHRIAWQEENYVDKRPKGIRQLTVKEMQKGFKEMAQKAREERFKKQQRLL